MRETKLTADPSDRLDALGDADNIHCVTITGGLCGSNCAEKGSLPVRF